MTTDPEGGVCALIELLDPRPGERVLDLGCGIGLASRRLVALGARVTGLDSDRAALEQARILVPQARFVCADLFAWMPEEPFDAVLARAVLDWLRPPDAAARRIAAWLRSGGRLAADLGGTAPAQRLLTEAAAALGSAPPAWGAPAPAEWVQALRSAGFDAAVRTGPARAALQPAKIRLLARKI